MIDPRAARFAAAVGALLIFTGLLLGPPWGLAPLALQTLVFAVGAVFGMTAQPWVRMFQRVGGPRLPEKPAVAPAQALQLDQFVNVAFTVTALLAGLVGLTGVFYVVVVVALINSAALAGLGRCAGMAVFPRSIDLRTRIEAELATPTRATRDRS